MSSNGIKRLWDEHRPAVIAAAAGVLVLIAAVIVLCITLGSSGGGHTPDGSNSNSHNSSDLSGPDASSDISAPGEDSSMIDNSTDQSGLPVSGGTTGGAGRPTTGKTNGSTAKPTGGNNASNDTSSDVSVVEPGSSQPAKINGRLNPYVTDSERWMGGYSVKDFGAKGDGKTNDSNAFKQAIAAAEAANKCAVYVPSGKYYVGSTITLSGGITLYGPYVSDVAAAENTMPTIIVGSSAPAGIAAPAGGSVIGLHIRCNDKGTDGIWSLTPGTRIDKCVITNANIGIHYESKSSNPGRGQITDVIIRSPHTVGAYIRDTLDFSYVNNVKVYGSSDLKASGTGFIFGQNDAVRVTGCYVTGASVGFEFNDKKESQSTWGTFRSLTAEDVDTAVRFSSVSTSLYMQPTMLMNSTFSARKVGIEVTAGCRSLTSFSSCTIRVSGGPAVKLSGNGSITVQGCTLESSSQTAVEIAQCENAIFTGNTVKAGKTGFDIANFRPNALVVTNNTIQASTRINDRSPSGDYKSLQ